MPNMTVKALGNIRITGNFATVQATLNRLMLAEIAAEPSPHQFQDISPSQDIDANAPFYVPGLSLSKFAR